MPLCTCQMRTYFCLKKFRDVLKKFMTTEAFVVDDVPVFLKAGVGCNRDAVGWGCVEVAVIGGIETDSSNETADGQNNLASSIPSDDDSVVSQEHENEDIEALADNVVIIE